MSISSTMPKSVFVILRARFIFFNLLSTFETWLETSKLAAYVGCFCAVRIFVVLLIVVEPSLLNRFECWCTSVTRAYSLKVLNSGICPRSNYLSPLKPVRSIFSSSTSFYSLWCSPLNSDCMMLSFSINRSHVSVMKIFKWLPTSFNIVILRCTSR